MELFSVKCNSLSDNEAAFLLDLPSIVKGCEVREWKLCRVLPLFRSLHQEALKKVFLPNARIIPTGCRGYSPAEYECKSGYNLTSFSAKTTVRAIFVSSQIMYTCVTFSLRSPKSQTLFKASLHL